MFVAIVIALSGLRLAAAAPQQPEPMTPDTGTRQAPIDLPAGASPRFTVVPLHGATNADLRAVGATIPMWDYTTTSSRDGLTYSGTMVGSASPFSSTDTTTTVTTQIVPLIFTIDGKIFDPTAADPCAAAPLPGTSDLTLFQQSPIFGSHAYTMNGVSIGTTQYVDAFEQASFWSLVGGRNDHVLLSPTTLPAVRVPVPAAAGNLYSHGCGGANNVGEIDVNWFQDYLENTLIPSLAWQGVSSTTFPIFLLTNVVMTDGSCCILGYHGAYGSPVQTYAVSNFDTTGMFGPEWKDTDPSSHEVAEWINDPLGWNPTPAWGNIGQVSGCQSNLEVGDPLSGKSFPAVTMPNGYTYHLQELAFYSWFFGAPNLGAGSSFSDNGTFTAQAPQCPPRGRSPASATRGHDAADQATGAAGLECPVHDGRDRVAGADLSVASLVQWRIGVAQPVERLDLRWRDHHHAHDDERVRWPQRSSIPCHRDQCIRNGDERVRDLDGAGAAPGRGGRFRW
jgi:hypothetical protein